ncbi:HMG domain-containing protein 3-like isoform X2 [Dendronephthya gigantea]|uniref:HMG domain-containing protein 3-like isoform X2 n=1 Tax=Dendronephthya gigantea TaxID=151771 RepID=UPI00106ACFA4|nr:HMG domain-containing protein 3-like isoform X2 [Dendronephthya gigantea]
MKLKLPYVIPKPIIQAAGKMDFSVWPEQFEPDQTLCDLCKSPLGQSKPHPNQRGRSIIMTNGCPFKTVKMLVKDCSCCFAMHQVFLYTLGLFNISDKVLVALEILLEFRELFKRGVPISVAMKSKLALMVQKVEAITECNMDSGVCGICSTVGEVYFGDGNEKNCCSISEIDYSPLQDIDCEEDDPISLEMFLEKLKYNLVEKTTYTRSEKATIHFSTIPPVIAPSLRGTKLFNTEGEKKVLFSSNMANLMKVIQLFCIIGYPLK